MRLLLEALGVRIEGEVARSQARPVEPPSQSEPDPKLAQLEGEVVTLRAQLADALRERDAIRDRLHHLAVHILEADPPGKVVFVAEVN